MAKFISDCIELDTNEKNHIIEMISSEPIPQKEIILGYLKNGQDNGVCCSSVYDFIESHSVPRTIHRYKDDIYEWDDSEIYHFEKYNLRLNDDFIKHVLSKET